MAEDSKIEVPDEIREEIRQLMQDAMGLAGQFRRGSEWLAMDNQCQQADVYTAKWRQDVDMSMGFLREQLRLLGEVVGFLLNRELERSGSSDNASPALHPIFAATDADTPPRQTPE